MKQPPNVGGSGMKPGIFEDIPLDDFTLTRVLQIASEKGTGFDKLCSMAVELIRQGALQELKRRGKI